MCMDVAGSSWKQVGSFLCDGSGLEARGLAWLADSSHVEVDGGNSHICMCHHFHPERNNPFWDGKFDDRICNLSMQETSTFGPMANVSKNLKFMNEFPLLRYYIKVQQSTRRSVLYAPSLRTQEPPGVGSTPKCQEEF